MYRRKLACCRKDVHSTKENRADLLDLELDTENVFLNVDSQKINRKPKLKCLTVSTSEQSESKKMNGFKLIKDMKRCVLDGKKSHSCRSLHSCTDLSYIFVKPNTANKSCKEMKMCEFLNSEGIFQINLGVVIKDYDISC